MMRQAEFENVCQAAQAGMERRVRHIITRQVGKIVACGPEDLIEVEVEEGEYKTWSRENIRLLQ
jgi:hypothetical protein